VDSRRNIQNVNYQQVNWLGADPDDIEVPGTFYINEFGSRWQDFMYFIHQKTAIRDKTLAAELKANPELTGADIIRQHPDPLEKYQELFAELLPNKKLQPIDPASPREFQYSYEGTTLPFNNLSSGEQEVVKIVFDLARKDIRHSVVIIDEPELHLHPALAFKLVETLKTLGDNTNQFIFLTHSADLISTYYSTGDVYFIDSIKSGENEAHRLSDLDNAHPEIAKMLGENLGLFAVGKRIVFVW
jgi:predicted ATPase